MDGKDSHGSVRKFLLQEDVRTFPLSPLSR